MGFPPPSRGSVMLWKNGAASVPSCCFFWIFSHPGLLGAQMLVHLEIMISWNTTGRSVLLAGAAACALACGTSDDKEDLFNPAQPPGQLPDVPPMVSAPLAPVEVPPTTVVATPTNTDTTGSNAML